MDVALVILHADPARGGAERYTVDLARALVERGQTVTLLATTFAQIDPRVRQVKLDAAAPTRLGGYLRFLDSLDAHLANHRYHIVHAMLPVRRCDVYHPHAGVAAEAVVSGHAKHRNPLRRALARLANRLNRKRQRFAAIERELLSGLRPPVVLCLSEYVKRTVRAHYPSLPSERLATLFNAVDLHHFDPAKHAADATTVRNRLALSKDRVIALLIAQDFERKGLREAILALRLVAAPRPALVVVGKQDPARYRKLAEQQGCAGDVYFAGPTTDPRAFYAAADLFVLPTRHDPCSLVVLEALAMGVPVISTAFNGACEIMRNGEHGFVLDDPANIESLAAAMGTMQDPTARQAMSRACIALRPRLAYEHHVEELLRIYSQHTVIDVIPSPSST